MGNEELVNVGEAEGGVALIEDVEDCAFEEGGGCGGGWGRWGWGGHDKFTR